MKVCNLLNVDNIYRWEIPLDLDSLAVIQLNTVYDPSTYGKIHPTIETTSFIQYKDEYPNRPLFISTDTRNLPYIINGSITVLDPTKTNGNVITGNTAIRYDNTAGNVDEYNYGFVYIPIKGFESWLELIEKIRNGNQTWYNQRIEAWTARKLLPAYLSESRGYGSYNIYCHSISLDTYTAVGSHSMGYSPIIKYDSSSELSVASSQSRACSFLRDGNMNMLNASDIDEMWVVLSVPNDGNFGGSTYNVTTRSFTPKVEYDAYIKLECTCWA